MLQYLTILLDDTSVPYCHAYNPLTTRHLMSIDLLKGGILFGMKGNLMIHFVYPEYRLPQEYHKVIESIDNVKIYPLSYIPFDGIYHENKFDIAISRVVPPKINCRNIVLLLSFNDAVKQQRQIGKIFSSVTRINICFTDIDSFDDSKIDSYKRLLEAWSLTLYELYIKGRMPQFNLLTDRMFLNNMNNCNAGVSNITLAPNGKFYFCPAFYYNEMEAKDNLLHYRYPSSDFSVGNIESGLNIPNQQLLSIDKAPLCRRCDAFQCKRCIWLNQNLTLECNTPSRQQCIMAHIERNASRSLLNRIKETSNSYIQLSMINEIDYLDPFDKITF